MPSNYGKLLKLPDAAYVGLSLILALWFQIKVKAKGPGAVTPGPHQGNSTLASYMAAYFGDVTHPSKLIALSRWRPVTDR